MQHIASFRIKHISCNNIEKEATNNQICNRIIESTIECGWLRQSSILNLTKNLKVQFALIWMYVKLFAYTKEAYSELSLGKIPFYINQPSKEMEWNISSIFSHGTCQHILLSSIGVTLSIYSVVPFITLISLERVNNVECCFKQQGSHKQEKDPKGCSPTIPNC